MTQVISKGQQLKGKALRTKFKASDAPITFEGKSADRRRVGKTRKDKASGAWSNRFANRAARVAEQNSSGGPGKARKG